MIGRLATTLVLLVGTPLILAATLVMVSGLIVQALANTWRLR